MLAGQWNPPEPWGPTKVCPCNLTNLLNEKGGSTVLKPCPLTVSNVVPQLAVLLATFVPYKSVDKFQEVL